MTRLNAPDLLQIRLIEQLSHLFFNANSDAVVIINKSGAIIHLNTQAEKLFGYQRDELLNQPVEMLLPEKIRTQHVEYRRRYFDTPLPRPMGSNLGGAGLHKDGSEIPIDIALSPLQTESGLYVASTIRDMRRQRQLENELRLHARDLENADRQKDHFLLTLGHELRTPLAAITYSAELLRRPNIADEIQDQAIRIMIDEIAFVRRLLDDLSDISRIRRDELPMNTTLINLNDIAHFAVEISSPLIKQHQHELEIAIPATSLPINGDAARITQIITNLLNNAALYTPNAGHIRLSVEKHNDTALIKVRDNGIGIPQDMLKQVFELFTRLDAARNKYTNGLGIGLAYVRRLAEIHGGSVEAFSDGEGLGSEFVVSLPLLRGMDAAAATLAQQTAAR